MDCWPLATSQKAPDDSPSTPSNLPGFLYCLESSDKIESERSKYGLRENEAKRLFGRLAVDTESRLVGSMPLGTFFVKFLVETDTTDMDMTTCI